MSRTPVLFIGHGSPMNTLERNGFTDAWRALGETASRPRALLVISAHWFFGATAVTAMRAAADDPRFLRLPAGAVRLRLSGSGDPRACRGNRGSR